MSREIKSKKEKHYKPGSLRLGTLFIMGLILAGLALCVVFIKLVNAFPGYPLVWLTTPISMIVGVFFMVLFIFMLNENHAFAGMAANIDEINTILVYHQFQNNKY